MLPLHTRPAWRAGILPVVFSLGFLALATCPTTAAAQEKTTSKPNAPKKGAAKAGEGRRGRGRRGRGRARARLLAIKVGTIHPVSGPDIKDGVILVQGGKIRRVGSATEVRVPAGATVLEYPEGHAYPGLVDALSGAFASPTDLTFGGTNAGSDFKDALDRDHKPSHKIIQSGVTTAYVSNRSNSTWRGLGVIIRPHKSGFARFRDRTHGGVELRMTTGTRSSHALTRQKQLLSHGKSFDALEAYEKKFKDHEKAMKEYEKKYKEYLDYFRKKKKGGTRPKGRGRGNKKETAKKEPPKKEPAKKDEPPKKEPPKKEPPKKETAKKEPPQNKKQAPKKEAGKATAKAASTKKDPKAPKKPKYPKPPKKVPASEALLKVKQGKLPLRVEVHRQDEIRAVLKMAREKELPQVVLEDASEAGDIAQELVDAGAPVVVSHLLPGRAKGTYDARRDGSLPGKLHGAGVAVAIASGGDAAEHLTLKAAWACGMGMPEDAAIRAITLTPAEILGVAEHVGSLDRGKVADVLITSGPLLKTDTRVLRVISQGQTQFDAKAAKAAKEAK